MRTKQIIMGLNNTQKFRAIINGVFVGDCMVKDLTTNRFPHQVQRVAVWEALMEVARGRQNGMMGMVNSFAGNCQGIDIQVDLV
jgi:hypothetical protein